MSREILYRKQFIKVDDNHIIPIIESGSSNCYEWANGNRQRRERSWFVTKMFCQGIIQPIDAFIKGIDEMRDRVKKNAEDYYTANTDCEWSKYNDEAFDYHTAISITGRRAISFKVFKGWFVGGVKNAMTVEELKEHNVNIEVCVYVYDTELLKKMGFDIKPSIDIKTTEQLISVVNEYADYYKNSNASVLVHYNSDWGLNKLRKRVKKEKTNVELTDYYTIKLKNGNGYFVRFTASGYRYTYFISSKAKIFKTEKQANKFHSNMRSKDLFEVEHITNKPIWICV